MGLTQNLTPVGDNRPTTLVAEFFSGASGYSGAPGSVGQSGTWSVIPIKVALNPDGSCSLGVFSGAQESVQSLLLNTLVSTTIVSKTITDVGYVKAIIFTVPSLSAGTATLTITDASGNTWFSSGAEVAGATYLINDPSTIKNVPLFGNSVLVVTCSNAQSSNVTFNVAVAY